MFTIATAYCGTGDNKAIRRLLHVAVRNTLLFSPFTFIYMYSDINFAFTFFSNATVYMYMYVSNV